MAARFVSGPRMAGSIARRRHVADRVARWTVTGGGLVVIASILGILVFLLLETLPLFAAANPGRWGVHDLGTGARILGVTADRYRTWFAVLDDGGFVRAGRFAGGGVAVTKDLFAGRSPRPRVVAGQTTAAGRAFAAATADGHVVVQPVGWKVRFEGGTRVVEPVLAEAIDFEVDPEGRPIGPFATTCDEDGAVSVVAQVGRRVVRVRQEWEVNDLLETKEAVLRRDSFQVAGSLTAIALAEDGREVVAAGDSGRLLWWKQLGGAARVVPAGHDRITAMGFLFGERAVVAGTEKGGLSVWSPARRRGGELRLTRIHDLPPLPEAVTCLAASRRNRGFVAADRAGNVGLYYATTAARRWAGDGPLGRVGAVAITPKADGLLVARADEVLAATLDDPHPEATAAALLGKVWYEGYDAPSHTWQSTGGSDDFEPKLGLVPLIFGTLKGTVFSLLLSVPLAVLGAMFVSQFLHPDLRALVKPAIEIMAALPSVILGFVAALWLAPVLEADFCAFLVMPVAMPVFVVLAGAAWTGLPQSWRGRWPAGSELAFFAAALVAAVWASAAASRPVETALFGGDFPAWARTTLGVTYEQKNAVVIAIALSFAVIPIIFTISEDALSNVPRNLVAASLALGANRWQTVTRVVLPTASPGIFSATMVGLGRAVGETMIVLMATGNTPIMDWDPFDGFRTLSANIAVEIPEAPAGGTLYRTLFLSALILFAFTFLINTVAELVRGRLRRRYAAL